MNAFDARRIETLARASGVSTRQWLIAAAQLARDGACAHPARHRRILAAARVPTCAAEQAAALLLTPIAGFALDETDRALALLWPAAVSAKT